MKRLIGLTVVFTFLCLGLSAQSVDDLKKERDEKDAQRAELQGQADALAGEVAALSDQITKLIGWRSGLNGTLGLNFNNNSKWGGNDNKSAAFAAGLTAFANKDTDASFWNNKGIATAAWQDVDVDGDGIDDGLFDNGNQTADVVNIASLYGYKLSDNFAISALGELNSTISKFNTGTLDIGVGATWTPVTNLVVVIHPLNYHLFYSPEDVDGNGALGAKIRADYTRSFPVAGKSIDWSSTFTTFFPYSEAAVGAVDLNEWQWINSLNFNIFKGIGVGVGFGFRDIKAFGRGTESFTSLGLSYGF